MKRKDEKEGREKRDYSCLELWDVIVKWDDICFKHILPRLNGTDVKFCVRALSRIWISCCHGVCDQKRFWRWGRASLTDNVNQSRSLTLLGPCPGLAVDQVQAHVWTQAQCWAQA